MLNYSDNSSLHCLQVFQPLLRSVFCCLSTSLYLGDLPKLLAAHLLNKDKNSVGNMEKRPRVSKVADKNKDKTVMSVLDLRRHLIHEQNKKAQHKIASLVHPQTLDFVLSSWRSQA